VHAVEGRFERECLKHDHRCGVDVDRLGVHLVATKKLCSRGNFSEFGATTLTTKLVSPGAIHATVPENEVSACCAPIFIREIPKSVSLACQRSSSSTFAAFMSRWITTGLSLCKYARPLAAP
jgi:hypothetical protein